MSTAGKKSKLANRLGYLRTETPRRKTPRGESAAAVLEGDWDRIGKYCYRRSSTAAVRLPEAIKPSPIFPRGSGKPRLLFFDTETTGLSGGAGNIVFLIGFGEQGDGNTLDITQYFLSDFPGEREFLTFLRPHFLESSDGETILVSYNGRAFDSPLLSSRFIMHGMQFPPAVHFDLLYPVRKLWRRILPACTLSVVEQEILGVTRDIDVPGSRIPEIYFSFIRTKDSSVLYPVFEHNKVDIVSLAQLLVKVNDISENPEASMDIDRTSLGKLYLDSNPDLGKEILKQEYAENNSEAGRILSLYLKRTGNLKEAAVVWMELWQKSPDIFSGIELAKYYEHHCREYTEALRIVEALLKKYPFHPAVHPELVHRRKRLERKIIHQDRSNTPRLRSQAH